MNKKKTTIRDFLVDKLPKKELDMVNRSFEVVGDIAICEIDSELGKYDKDIGEAIMNTNKNIKVVLKKSGIHKGEFRTQDLIHVAGENRKQSNYLENGVRFIINPETVYFSARLSTERCILMEKLKGNKRVLVMFSGAGPYSLTAFKKQPNISRITSIEINPEGHKYAVESSKLNRNIIKKSSLYLKIVKFLKSCEVPVYDKVLTSLLNKLKLNFINGDVRVEIEKLKLKEFDENIENFHNELFSQNDKDLIAVLRKLNLKKIYLDLNNIDKDKILIPFILYSSKFNFVCKIGDKSYLFDDDLTKGYLLNYLEGNFDIDNINLFDEIYMPLPKDAELFLDCAFKTADKDCVVHMYDFVNVEDFPLKSENAVKKAAKKFGRDVKIIETRKVGQYSPRKYRVCCDFKIE